MTARSFNDHFTPFDTEEEYTIQGSVLAAIWQEVYLPMVEDDGTPAHAIKGDLRRDMAQRLAALLQTAGC